MKKILAMRGKLEKAGITLIASDNWLNAFDSEEPEWEASCDGDNPAECEAFHAALIAQYQKHLDLGPYRSRITEEPKKGRPLSLLITPSIGLEEMIELGMLGGSQ